MTETLTDGQDAPLRLLARAARALLEEGRISTDGLLPSYRALAPAAHPRANADVVDAGFIARCHALGGDALLAARTLVVAAAPPRGALRVVDGAVLGVGDHAAGDALALALGLSLEAAKLVHGLSAPSASLAAAFATPADARRALEALAKGGAARDVDVSAFLSAQRDRVEGGRLTLAAKGRPTYVVVGAGGRRVLDLVSPFARRMRTELAALGAGHGGARADDVYAGIATLCATDDAVDDERVTAEASEGVTPLGPGAIAVRCELLVEAEVDGRVREAATALKRARALIVCVEERASSLRAVLEALHRAEGGACRAVLLVVEGGDDEAPAFVTELASGHVVALDNALAAAGSSTSTISLPSLALRPGSAIAGGVIDDALFPLVQAAMRARADGILPAAARLGVKTIRAGDVSSMSACCIEVLGRLGPPQREKPRR